MIATALKITESLEQSSPRPVERSAPELVFDPLLDRFDLTYVLRKHWWKLLIGPLIGCVIALFVYGSKQALYESSAEILVDPGFETILQYETVGGARASAEGLHSLERAFVADSILLRVVDKLGLRDEPGFLPEGMSGAGAGALAAYLRDERVSASLVPDTRVIQISVLDPSPERAHRIATALTTEFETFVADQRRGEGEQTLAALERQAEEARESALESEEQLRVFREASELPVEQDYDLFTTRLTQLESDLTEARAARRELAAKVNILGGLESGRTPAEIIEASGYHDLAHVSGLMTAEAGARTRLDVVAQRYREKHPNHKAAVAELRRCEEQLRRLAEDTVGLMGSRLSAAEQRERDLTEQLEEQLAMLGGVKASSSKFRALQQQAERSWQEHELLQKKLGESAVAAEQAMQIGTVVSEPMVPSDKASPNKLLHLVLGGAAGALPGMAFLLVGLLSGFPFSHTGQLEGRFGLPVIADWSDADKIEDNPRPAKMLSFLAASAGKIVQVSAPQLGAASREVSMRMGRLSAEHGRRTLLIAVGEDVVSGGIEPSGIDDLKLLSLGSDIVTDMTKFPHGLEALRRDFDNVLIEASRADDPDMADYISYHADLDVIVVGKDMTKKSLIDERVRRSSDLGSGGIAMVMIGEDEL